MQRFYKDLPCRVITSSMSLAIGLVSIAIETGAYLFKSKKWSKLAMQLELYGFELTEQTLYHNQRVQIERKRV